MPVVILKFGGKLLETPEHIKKVAGYIINIKKNGDDPVIVVSAPGKTTDKFLEMVKQVTTEPDERELDMLLSVGERTGMSLLAMAVNSASEYRAVSFTGSQVGIITDTQHTNAKIIEVKGYRIHETLEKGYIPIIAGFQGVSIEREITTLGRGGSDATAVALAIALKAERCELVKECGGVFTADPELIQEAVKRDEIDFNTLESLTNAGAKIVQSRAVTLAKDNDVNLKITGIDRNNGTIVTDRIYECGLVAGIVLENELFFCKLNALDFSGHMDWRLFNWSDSDGIVVTTQSGNEDFKPAALITIIGWAGVLKNEVAQTVYEVLRKSELSPLAVSGNSGVLSLLVESSQGKELVRKVHSVCLENGFLLPN